MPDNLLSFTVSKRGRIAALGSAGRAAEGEELADVTLDGSREPMTVAQLRNMLTTADPKQLSRVMARTTQAVSDVPRADGAVRELRTLYCI
jgi:hypothetical protein